MACRADLPLDLKSNYGAEVCPMATASADMSERLRALPRTVDRSEMTDVGPVQTLKRRPRTLAEYRLSVLGSSFRMLPYIQTNYNGVAAMSLLTKKNARAAS